jgi:hypothetical protein
MPAPRAASPTTPVPPAALSTTPAPRAAPSTPTARFADPALVYHRRRHGTTSAPVDPGPSTSAVRLADPAVVYHCRESATPAAPDVPTICPEPSVYHSVAIHRDPGYVHPMVTRRAAGVLRPVDRLILAADTTTTPPSASRSPPPFAPLSPTHTGDAPWRRSTRPSWPTTPGT